MRRLALHNTPINNHDRYSDLLSTQDKYQFTYKSGYDMFVCDSDAIDAMKFCRYPELYKEPDRDDEDDYHNISKVPIDNFIYSESKPNHIIYECNVSALASTKYNYHSKDEIKINYQLDQIYKNNRGAMVD